MNDTDRLERPVFVVGSPRSGTTLMQNLLCRDPSVYRLGRESRFLWHRLRAQELTGRFPEREAITSAYLSELFIGESAWTHEQMRRWALRCASQGTPAQYLDLPHDLIAELVTDGRSGPFATSEQTETAPFTLPPLEATFASETTGPVRMVDKDTGHCWRLPELAVAFPDATFVLVVRDPLPAVRSLIAGWCHPDWFFTYRVSEDLDIAGYSDVDWWGRHWWNFNLFPDYENYLSSPLVEVCMQQWVAAMIPVVEHGMSLVREGRAIFTSYESLVEDSDTELARIAEATGLDAEAICRGGLETNYMTMRPDTWTPRADPADLARRASIAREVLSPMAHLVNLPAAR